MAGLFDFSEDPVFGNGPKKQHTAGAQPDYVPYVQGYDPETMSMQAELQRLWPQYSKGYDAFQTEALRKGPSNWLNMSLLASDLKKRDAMEKAVDQNSGRVAKAKNALAAGGGLSSGARERAEETGMTDLMNMTQGIERQNEEGDLNLGIQDETNRLTALSALPGMENQKLSMWTNAKGQDVNNAVNEVGRRNNYNMSKYQADMSAWAANKQADATANSGKK